MSSPPRIRLRLLGSPCLAGNDDAPLCGPPAQRHRLALLALLSLSPTRGMARETLTAYLWPERDSEHARLLLNQSVHALRKALGIEVILSAGDELRLDTDALSTDAVAFRKALEAGELPGAVALYSGPFLDGFSIPDAPEFERWAEAEREQFRQDHWAVLEGLAWRAVAEGDVVRAVRWWRRRVAADPYDARITLRLMEALEAAGDRAGAIRQARIHATLLERELDAEPDPQVGALAQRLRREPAGIAASTEAPSARHPAGTSDSTVDNTRLDEIHGRDGSRTPRPLVTATARAPRGRVPRSGMVVPIGAIVGITAVLTAVWLLPEANPLPGAATEAAVSSAKAVAVLPCANLSREEEYFSDGLTEELISRLSQVRSLRVPARTSAFAFKGKDRDIRDIGRALNVGRVLECSVRRERDRVRVTAQLIDAADGFHLWADSYEREGTDVFAIQTELALQIVRALEAELTPAERTRLARRPTTSTKAYALYLKGRHVWNRGTKSGYTRAIEYFEGAIEADPRYARAYAGLASAYAMQGLSGDLAPGEADQRTKAAVLRALELDAGLAEAHTALGSYYEAYAWNSEAAERELLRALELDPNYSTAHHWYGNVLTSLGRFDQAIAEKRKAVELDPLAPVVLESLSHTLLRAGRVAEAFEALRHAIELDSTYWRAHAELGSLYETTGQLDAAVRAHRRAAELAGPNSSARAGLARVLAVAGMKDEAQRILDELQAEATGNGIYAPGVATVLLALSDLEGALTWLERSYEQRHPQLRYIGGPSFARIEQDPHYLNLRRRIGLR